MGLGLAELGGAFLVPCGPRHAARSAKGVLRGVGWLAQRCACVMCWVISCRKVLAESVRLWVVWERVVWHHSTRAGELKNLLVDING